MQKACKVKRKNSGITLIEALLVLAILAGASVLVLLDFRASERRFALQNAAQQLSLDLRRAQHLTLQAREEGGAVPARYGIHIESTQPSSYILFADQEGVGNEEEYDSGEELEEIKFPTGVRFPTTPSGVARVRSASGGPCPSPPPLTTSLDITFEPPDPRTIVRRTDASPAACFKACIILKTQNALDRIVGVTQTGLVNVYSGSTALNDCVLD